MKDKKGRTHQHRQQGNRPAKQRASLMEVQEKLGLFKPPPSEQVDGEHKFLERKPLGFI